MGTLGGPHAVAMGLAIRPLAVAPPGPCPPLPKFGLCGAKNLFLFKGFQHSLVIKPAVFRLADGTRLDESPDRTLRVFSAHQARAGHAVAPQIPPGGVKHVQ